VATVVNITTSVCSQRVTNVCVRDRMSANIYIALLSSDEVPCILSSCMVSVCSFAWSIVLSTGKR